MILYHGSNTDIAEIDLSVSKVGKDFGCGFYLSADKEQALELAARKTEQLGVGTPMLNSYEFDENSLHGRGLSVLEFQEYSREWAEFVLMNRRNRTRVPSHSYDIVIGPIVNDSVGFQIRRLTSGLIDMDKFLEELKYMKGDYAVPFRYGEVYPIFNQSKWIMTKEQFMIEEISKEIVLLLMEEHQMDMREALKALYTSDTYSRLINLDTGLYAQSTAYVYEYLEKELVMGKMV